MSKSYPPKPTSTTTICHGFFGQTLGPMGNRCGWDQWPPWLEYAQCYFHDSPFRRVVTFQIVRGLVNVPMFHITQLLGIQSPTDICFGDGQNPKRDIYQALLFQFALTCRPVCPVFLYPIHHFALISSVGKVCIHCTSLSCSPGHAMAKGIQSILWKCPSNWPRV